MAQSLYRVIVTDPQTGAQSYKRNSAKWNAVNETARDAVKQLGLRVDDIQMLDSQTGQYVTDYAAMEEFHKLFNGKTTAGNPVVAYELGQFAELCKAMQKDLKKSELTDEDISEFVHNFAALASMLGVSRDFILKATKSA